MSLNIAVSLKGAFTRDLYQIRDEYVVCNTFVFTKEEQHEELRRKNRQLHLRCFV